jgi:hypothetical protein
MCALSQGVPIRAERKAQLEARQVEAVILQVPPVRVEELLVVLRDGTRGFRCHERPNKRSATAVAPSSTRASEACR